MLQDNIDSIKPYFKSLESFNDALIIRVQFPPRWAVFPSDDGMIKPAPSEQRANEFFYYGDGKKVTLEDIFSFIKDTVEINQSIEKKAKLLVEKIEELKALFEKTPFEDLKTLTFELHSIKKTKPKRKYTKRKKIQPDAEEAPKNESAITNNNDSIESGVTEGSKDDNHIKVSSSTLNKLELARKRKT